MPMGSAHALVAVKLSSAWSPVQEMRARLSEDFLRLREEAFCVAKFGGDMRKSDESPRSDCK